MSKRRKKRKLKLGNIFIFISLIVLFVLVGIYAKKEFLDGNNDSISPSSIVVDKKKSKENKEKIEETTMITAGDNLIHSSVYKDAQNYAENGEDYNFKPIYEYLKPIVSNYDIKYYNQETILGGKEIGVSDYPTFNSPQEVGDAMIDMGFNLVSLATNHTLDSGTQAILNSREYWNKQEGVLAVGSYSSNEEKEEVHIQESNGITYTMLNYTYGTNGISIPTGKDYLVNVWPTDIDNINDPESDTEYQDYKTQVKEDIEKVRDKVDLLIVAMHWGVEYTHEPTEYEKDMANFLAENGVDVIVGTHPHVIQPVTWIDDTLVIYSLGNLVSAQYQDTAPCSDYKCTTGLMTSFKITKTTKNKKSSIKISDVSNELIYTYYSGWRNFKVVPFSNENIAKYLPSYQSVYNTYKEVVQRYNEDMNVVAAYHLE